MTDMASMLSIPGLGEYLGMSSVELLSAIRFTIPYLWLIYG